MGALRGCLTTLVLGAVVLGLLVWFALPAAAGFVFGAALVASGFQGTDTNVTVTASPPYRLLVGHADAVRIESSQVTFQGLHAATVDLTASSVDLVGRRYQTIFGTITGVTFAGAGGMVLSSAAMIVSGSSGATTATVILDPTSVQQAISAAVAGAIGVTPSSVTLAAPAVVTVTIAGQRLSGTLVITPTGGIALKPAVAALPAVDVLPAGSTQQFTVRRLSVTPAGVEVVASITLSPFGS